MRLAIDTYNSSGLDAVVKDNGDCKKNMLNLPRVDPEQSGYVLPVYGVSHAGLLNWNSKLTISLGRHRCLLLESIFANSLSVV